MLANLPGDLCELCNGITHSTAMGLISLMYTSKLSSAQVIYRLFRRAAAKLFCLSFFSRAEKQHRGKGTNMS